MAVVTVVPYAFRLDANDALDGATAPYNGTSWTNLGGGGSPTVDDQLVYQGTAAISRQLSNQANRGIEKTYNASFDATTEPSASVWMCKLYVTVPGAIVDRTTPGLRTRIGSSDASYHEYWIDGGNTYPPLGGWRIVAIDPTITEYVDDTNDGNIVGGPVDFTIFDYIGLLNEFSVAVRGAENTVIDAIDFGKGLNLVGGDGGDTDGNFRDFVEFDGDTENNRYGFAYGVGTSIVANGTLTIGEETGSAQTAVATEFTSTGDVILFQNGYFENGFTGLKYNVANSSTIIDVENSTFIGEGELNNSFGGRVTSSQDTRPNFEVTGSLGQFTSSANVYQNFSSGSFSATSLVAGGSMELAHLTQNSAEISSVKIITTSTSSFATLQDFDDGGGSGTSGLYNCTFVQGNDGHAMVISGSSFSFFGLKFEGYGNTASDSASVYVSASTGTVTINVTNGGDIPTYKTNGATVVIQQTIDFKILGAQSGSEIQLVSQSGADLDTAAGTNVDVTQAIEDNGYTYQYTYPGYDQDIYLIVHSLGFEYLLREEILGNSNQSVRVQQVSDRNYDNPE